MVDPVIWDIGYLVSAALFILGIKRLSSPRTAPQGNRLGAYGMLLAVLVTMAKLYSDGLIGLELIAGGLIIGTVIGAWLAIRVEMTGMPELVALFNGFGGGASALVSTGQLSTQEARRRIFGAPLVLQHSSGLQEPRHTGPRFWLPV